jgi:hypothetical protein
MEKELTCYQGATTMVRKGGFAMVEKKNDASVASEEADPKKRRTRSPLYPAFNLQEALNKARELYDGIHQHKTDMNAAAEHWGIKPTSSAVAQNVSALKQFRLLQDTGGSGEDREVRLSETALDILLHEPPHLGRRAAIKTAALSPKLHAELWAMYGGNLPPADSAIRSFLLRHKNFNPGAVDDFIKQFRETIVFAELNENDKIPEEEDGRNTGDSVARPVKPSAWSEPLPKTPPPPPPAAPQPQRRLPVQAGIKEDLYALNSGQVIIQWPEKIDPEEIDDLEGWLQIVIRKVKRSVRAEEDRQE